MVVMVVTRDESDDSNSISVEGGETWLRISRLERTLASHYPLDGETWHMVRYVCLGDAESFEVRFLAQSPTGEGLPGELPTHLLHPSGVGGGALGCLSARLSSRAAQRSHPPSGSSGEQKWAREAAAGPPESQPCGTPARIQDSVPTIRTVHVHGRCVSETTRSSIGTRVMVDGMVGCHLLGASPVSPRTHLA